MLHGCLDAILYKYFPLTLAGEARNWYGNLALRLLSSYSVLSQKFIPQFQGRGARKRMKNTCELLNKILGRPIVIMLNIFMKKSN